MTWTGESISESLSESMSELTSESTSESMSASIFGAFYPNFLGDRPRPPGHSPGRDSLSSVAFAPCGAKADVTPSISRILEFD